jgi:hypothetical protein
MWRRPVIFDGLRQVREVEEGEVRCAVSSVEGRATLRGTVHQEDNLMRIATTVAGLGTGSETAEAQGGKNLVGEDKRWPGCQ